MYSKETILKAKRRWYAVFQISAVNMKTIKIVVCSPTFTGVFIQVRFLTMFFYYKHTIIYFIMPRTTQRCHYCGHKYSFLYRFKGTPMCYWCYQKHYSSKR
jgi:hypothetical protein